MADRAKEIESFLREAGWSQAIRKPLAGDASHRKYQRLHDQERGISAVLMDAPPETNGSIAPFISIAMHLGRIGMSAPDPLLADESSGLLLLEDLGDSLLARVFEQRPDVEMEISETVVDCLASLQGQPAPEGIGVYDLDMLARLATLSLEWYARAAGGKPPGDSERDGLGRLVAEACAPASREKPVLTLRDFHAENLIWLPEREGIRRVGLLDFQDALLAHPAYDLASFLDDVRRQTPPRIKAAMVSRFIERGGHDKATFLQRYAALCAQRSLRILGVFARLCIRDRKPSYLRFMPRVWETLMDSLRHESLRELEGFVRENIPAPDREALERVRSHASRS